MPKENKLVLSYFLYTPKDTEIAKLERLEKPFQFHAASFEPKEEDFIYAPFRLISAHIVGADSWQATDFSDEEILKKSIPLLEGKPAYIDHNTYSVKNSIGTIVNLRWVEKYTDELGNEIPAGIEGDYRIDAVSNNKIARSVLNGEIQGSSVTIAFMWTPSHTFEEDYMFEWRCGETINGEMVRRIVTEVVDYYETSLVFRPADPYAKPITIANHPANKEGIKRLQDEPEAIKKLYQDNQTFSLFDGTTIQKMQFMKVEKQAQNLETPILEQQKKEFEVLMNEIKGLQHKITEQNDINIAQQTTMQELEKENLRLSQQIEQDKQMVEVGKNTIDFLRAETKRVYQLSTQTPSEAYLKMIEEANFESLKAIAETFKIQMLAQFTPVCAECGGKNVSFQTSKTPETNTNEKTEREPQTLLEVFKTK